MARRASLHRPLSLLALLPLLAFLSLGARLNSQDDCGYKSDGNYHCGTNCGYKSDGRVAHP